jgi:phage shock protein C
MSERGLKKPPSRSRLYRRPKAESKVAGVCGGLADYLGINASFVRVCVLLGLFTFTLPTLLGYIVLAWALDERPQGLFETDEERAFWRGVRVEPSQTVSGLSHKFRALELRLRGIEAQVTSPGFKMDQDLRHASRE